jgi:hypothetical protein
VKRNITRIGAKKSEQRMNRILKLIIMKFIKSGKKTIQNTLQIGIGKV